MNTMQIKVSELYNILRLEVSILLGKCYTLKRLYTDNEISRRKAIKLYSTHSNRLAVLFSRCEKLKNISSIGYSFSFDEWDNYEVFFNC